MVFAWRDRKATKVYSQLSRTLGRYLTRELRNPKQKCSSLNRNASRRSVMHKANLYLLLQNRNNFITSEAVCGQHSNAVRCKELSPTSRKRSTPIFKLWNPKRIVYFFLVTEYHSTLGWFFFSLLGYKKTTTRNWKTSYFFPIPLRGPQCTK